MPFRRLTDLPQEVNISSQISIKGFHHATLTVTDVKRSAKFYTDVLGLNLLAELSPTRYLVGNDSVVFAIGEPPNPEMAPVEDSFNENRVGLDHFSFAVESIAEMERAKRILTEAGAYCGEVKELSGLGFAVMAFRDPDNIQLELSAPLA